MGNGKVDMAFLSSLWTTDRAPKNPTEALISGKTVPPLHSRLGRILAFASTPNASLWHTAIHLRAR